MKRIQMDRRTYLKTLRNVHPMDRFDPGKRLVNAVGRLTARSLNKNTQFNDLLREGKMRQAGTVWHSSAKQVLDRVVARLGLRPGTVRAEATLQAGAGGGRADVLLRGIGRVALGEIDWKPHIRTAIRGIGQMRRHAGQTLRRFGAAPQMQELRNWIDYIREVARDAAKNLPKQGTRSSAKATSKAPSPAQARVSGAAAQKLDRSTLRVTGSTLGKGALTASGAPRQPRMGARAVSKPQSSASESARTRGPSFTTSTSITADKLRASVVGNRPSARPELSPSRTSTPITADKLRVSAPGGGAKPSAVPGASSSAGPLAANSPATGPHAPTPTG